MSKTNNNYLFGMPKDKEVQARMMERRKLGEKFPGTKAELIALAQSTSIPIKVLPPATAPGAYMNIFEKNDAAFAQSTTTAVKKRDR